MQFALTLHEEGWTRHGAQGTGAFRYRVGGMPPKHQAFIINEDVGQPDGRWYIQRIDETGKISRNEWYKNPEEARKALETTLNRTR